MQHILSFDGILPSLAENAFVAPGACVIGKVVLERDCSVWFNAVLRADGDWIRVGAGTNIQDGAVVHVDPGCPVTMGKDCIIGHRAIVHGATLGNNVLVGMGATILNNARIGNYCLIGANALVTEGMEIPEGSLVVGAPAKVIRTLDEAARERIRKNAEGYKELAQRYLLELS